MHRYEPLLGLSLAVCFTRISVQAWVVDIPDPKQIKFVLGYALSQVLLGIVANPWWLEVAQTERPGSLRPRSPQTHKETQ